jgi:hypothetical protein
VARLPSPLRSAFAPQYCPSQPWRLRVDIAPQMDSRYGLSTSVAETSAVLSYELGDVDRKPSFFFNISTDRQAEAFCITDVMATTIEEPDFKLFPKLPQELQDEVWDATSKLSTLILVFHAHLHCWPMPKPMRLKESVLVLCHFMRMTYLPA